MNNNHQSFTNNQAVKKEVKTEEIVFSLSISSQEFDLSINEQKNKNNNLTQKLLVALENKFQDIPTHWFAALSAPTQSFIFFNTKSPDLQQKIVGYLFNNFEDILSIQSFLQECRKNKIDKKVYLDQLIKFKKMEIDKHPKNTHMGSLISFYKSLNKSGITPLDLVNYQEEFKFLTILHKDSDKIDLTDENLKILLAKKSLDYISNYQNVNHHVYLNYLKVLARFSALPIDRHPVDPQFIFDYLLNFFAYKKDLSIYSLPEIMPSLKIFTPDSLNQAYVMLDTFFNKKDLFKKKYFNLNKPEVFLFNKKKEMDSLYRDLKCLITINESNLNNNFKI